MGGIFGSTAASFFTTILDTVMKGLWTASLTVLRAVFTLVDVLTGFSLSVDSAGNPMDPSLAGAWGTLRTLSLIIALGLFFWQLISMVLHGGRGFFRAVTGPFAYGIALAATGGVVAVLLAASDELTHVLLAQGFQGATSFAGLLDNPKFGGLFTLQGQGQTALNGVSATALGVIAIFGVFPAGLGYLGEMVFRMAAIFVLFSTIPVAAAGLLAQVTSSWFWKTLRWSLAAILMKPALALVLVIGVSLLANPQGLAGVLAGIGVLLISLMCPFTLFRLLSFVDPGTSSGAASRAWASSALSSMMPGGGGGGQVDTSSGMDSAEASNTARFDQGGGGGGGGGATAAFGLAGQAMEQVSAAAGTVSNFANAQMDATGVGDPGGGRTPSSSGGAFGPSGSSGGGGSGGGPDGDTPDAGGPPPDPTPPTGGGHGGGQDPSGGGGGIEPPVPAPPSGGGHGGGHDDDSHGGGAGGGGARSGGGRGVSAGEIEEAAVVV